MKWDRFNDNWESFVDVIKQATKGNFDIMRHGQVYEITELGHKSFTVWVFEHSKQYVESHVWAIAEPNYLQKELMHYVDSRKGKKAVWDYLQSFFEPHEYRSVKRVRKY